MGSEMCIRDRYLGGDENPHQRAARALGKSLSRQLVALGFERAHYRPGPQVVYIDRQPLAKIEPKSAVPQRSDVEWNNAEASKHDNINKVSLLDQMLRDAANPLQSVEWSL